MKKFTKLFLSCAAVAAVTAAVATSAMAAEVELQGQFAGKYNTETGMLSITAPTDLKEGTQATLLVLPANVDPTEDNVSPSDVVGIDQATGANFDKSGLKDKPQAPASGNTKYKVYLGYYAKDAQDSSNFKIAISTLLLGKEEGVEITLGNVDGNSILGTNGVGAQDAAYILRYSTNGTGAKGEAGTKITLVEEATANGVTIPAGTTIALGDVDGNHILGTDGVSAQDAAYILRYATKNEAAKGLAGVKVKATIVETEE